mgnify:FL=1
MNEKLDYKFGKYDLDFLIKLKAHEFRKQKIDNISEKEIRNYLFNIKWKSQKSLPMCDIIDDVMNLQREVIYKQRAEVLDGKNLKEQIEGMIEEVITSSVNSHLVGEHIDIEEDIKELLKYLEDICFPHLL